MYFETWRAVGDHVEYEKTDDGDWRAAFCGAFTVSAEARTPDAALMEVERQIDKLVAEWVVHPRRRVARPERGMTRRARRNSVPGPREGGR
jgi:predicted RNase H-like HicB family nuclease